MLCSMREGENGYGGVAGEREQAPLISVKRTLIVGHAVAFMARMRMKAEGPAFGGETSSPTLRGCRGRRGWRSPNRGRPPWEDFIGQRRRAGARSGRVLFVERPPSLLSSLSGASRRAHARSLINTGASDSLLGWAADGYEERHGGKKDGRGLGAERQNSFFRGVRRICQGTNSSRRSRGFGFS